MLERAPIGVDSDDIAELDRRSHRIESGAPTIPHEAFAIFQSGKMGQLAWSPVAQGVLTGKYRPGAAPPPGSRATDGLGQGFISQPGQRERTR